MHNWIGNNQSCRLSVPQRATQQWDPLRLIPNSLPTPEVQRLKPTALTSASRGRQPYIISLIEHGLARSGKYTLEIRCSRSFKPPKNSSRSDLLPAQKRVTSAGEESVEESSEEEAEREDPLQSFSMSQETLLGLNSDQLFDLFTGAKEGYRNLQTFIEKAPESLLEKMASKLLPYLAMLCSSQQGNYPVQSLVKRVPSFLKEVQVVCMHLLESQSLGQASSKVIKTCLTIDPLFCSCIIKECEARLDFFMKEGHTVGVICQAIKMVPSESQLAFMLAYLEKKPNIWLKRKYFKRVIISLLRYCSATFINQVYEILSKTLPLTALFVDKHSIFILLALVERNHEKTIESLEVLITRDVAGFIELKYFRLFLITLHREGNRRLLDLLHRSLIADQGMIALLGHADKTPQAGDRICSPRWLFGCGVLALSSNSAQFEALEALWLRVEQFLSPI